MSTGPQSTRKVRLRSLAKINLDLRVLHKRPDGFHELRTLFQTISLADTLSIEFTPARETKIELSSPVNIPDNLVLRAANRILEATESTGDLKFHLEKNIPMGGGLGGGSSNAAAVLLALPVLLGKTLPLEKLMELAAGLGSDVPFFLFGGTALGLGRGTELYPAPQAALRPAILVTPGVHVSTAEAYGGLNRKLTGEEPSRNIGSFQSLLWGAGSGRLSGQTGGYWAMSGEFINDFESVVFRVHPPLESIKGKLLESGAKPALMSGSGSTLFGIFENRLLRDSAIVRLRQDYGEKSVHPVALVSQSRYRSLWRRQLGTHMEDNLWPPRSRYLK
jgi:4-diphosphocytidyl-2-C-methyl-D-erythritol kinase